MADRPVDPRRAPCPRRVLYSGRRVGARKAADEHTALQRSQGGANTEDGGYHETLTCFWHGVIRDFIGALPPGLDRLGIVRAVVTEFAPKRDLFREFYDFDVVKSREARAKWIPPAPQ